MVHTLEKFHKVLLNLIHSLPSQYHLNLKIKDRRKKYRDPQSRSLRKDREYKSGEGGCK